MSEKYKRLARSIGAGEFDGEIEALEIALRLRREVLDAEKAQGLQAGDIVRLKNMRPKYVNGMTGTVLAVSGARVLCEVQGLEKTRYLTQSWIEAKNLDVVPVESTRKAPPRARRAA